MPRPPTTGTRPRTSTRGGSLDRGGAAASAARGGGGSAAARLLATQMAVSGSSRVEIETRLRSGFEIEDTNEILDAILGTEG